ncbi:MAG: DUF1330 domain-containing protein [Burkholderiales bacterium]|jgi:uncharacterized protein (DUF1330 family)
MAFAYAIITSQINDAEQFKEYLAATPATLIPHGGEYLVRGGAKTIVEGGWDPDRLVVLRFPSMANARAWYDGAGYTKARALRKGATEYFNVLFVEGYEP